MECAALQQDKAPTHTACLTKQFLVNNDANAMRCPARSPDLKPIGNLSGMMIRLVCEGRQKFHNSNDLEIATAGAWSNISLQICRKLVELMSWRFIFVTRRDAAKTDYQVVFVES